MRVKGVSGWSSGVQLFRGHFQVYGHPKYGMVITKWPRKRGPAKTQAGADNQATFAQVVKWAKNPLSSEVTEAQRGTFQTGYLIRDAIESQCYGLVTFGYTTTGDYIISQRLGNMQIQPLLDSIGMSPGDMLVRTVDGWVVLSPGTDGDVLTARGPSQPPEWLPATGSGGGGAFTVAMIIAGTFAEAHASIGNILFPVHKTQLIAANCVLTTITNAHYKVGIAEYDVSTAKLKAAPTYSDEQIITTGAANATLYFAVAFNMDAGKSYLLFIVRTDATSTTSITMNASASAQAIVGPGFYLSPASGITARVLSSLSPGTGDAWSSGGTGSWAISPIYTLND